MMDEKLLVFIPAEDERVRPVDGGVHQKQLVLRLKGFHIENALHWNLLVFHNYVVFYEFVNRRVVVAVARHCQEELPILRERFPVSCVFYRE